MKNPFDVLRTKEQELLRVKREAEALRVTAPLLDNDVPPAKKPQRQEVIPLDLEDMESKLSNSSRGDCTDKYLVSSAKPSNEASCRSSSSGLFEKPVSGAIVHLRQ